MSRVIVCATGLAIGSLSLVLSGCAGDSVSPELREELVAFGFLYVGEAVSDSNAILVSRTAALDEFYEFDRAAVTNATVTIHQPASAVTDTLTMFAPGRYSRPTLNIQANTTYQLRISIPGEPPVTAETTTPSVIAMQQEPRLRPGVMSQATIPDSFPLVFTCDDEEQILLLDVYCEEEWQDARYLDPVGDHDRPDDFDEYGRENREPRHISAYFRVNDLEQDPTGFRVSFYSAMMVFWGSYDVQLLSIDDNFYDYLYREHPEESGGIVGGIGVFGSACRRRYAVEIVP